MVAVHHADVSLDRGLCIGMLFSYLVVQALNDHALRLNGFMIWEEKLLNVNSAKSVLIIEYSVRCNEEKKITR